MGVDSEPTSMASSTVIVETLSFRDIGALGKLAWSNKAHDLIQTLIYRWADHHCAGLGHRWLNHSGSVGSSVAADVV